ncbi:hypothetical protein LZ30DRAFT_82065 [Colletotrichum cereale]|nr:hypothetical protein LZ30DRAFT_82065 [Colletotrichum cereale]
MKIATFTAFITVATAQLLRTYDCQCLNSLGEPQDMSNDSFNCVASASGRLNGTTCAGLKQPYYENPAFCDGVFPKGTTKGNCTVAGSSSVPAKPETFVASGFTLECNTPTNNPELTCTTTVYLAYASDPSNLAGCMFGAGAPGLGFPSFSATNSIYCSLAEGTWGVSPTVGGLLLSAVQSNLDGTVMNGTHLISDSDLKNTTTDGRLTIEYVGPKTFTLDMHI